LNWAEFTTIAAAGGVPAARAVREGFDRCRPHQV